MYRKPAKSCAAASAVLLSVLLPIACGTEPTTPPTTPTPTATAPSTAPKIAFDFRNGAQGWEAGFADYPPGEEQSYKLESGVRALPAGIEPKGTGYYIAGNNHSDDLFMFLKRKLGAADGVQPNTAYRLKFKIVFASNAPSGCLGIGGAPGEGVTLKAGGSDVEPKPVEQDKIYRMNVKKGEQTTGGPAGEVAGDIANGRPCEQAPGSDQPYVSLTKEHTGEITVKSSGQGDLWPLAGTDSGFEGLTALYYRQIDVELIKGPE
jgi:hypothetical protein